MNNSHTGRAEPTRSFATGAAESGRHRPHGRFSGRVQVMTGLWGLLLAAVAFALGGIAVGTWEIVSAATTTGLVLFSALLIARGLAAHTNTTDT